VAKRSRPTAAPELVAANWRENFDQTLPRLGIIHSMAQGRLLSEYVEASLVRLRLDWFEVLSWKEDVSSGVLDNVPEQIPELKSGALRSAH
jgi:hypothetical protein